MTTTFNGYTYSGEQVIIDCSNDVYMENDEIMISKVNINPLVYYKFDNNTNDSGRLNLSGTTVGQLEWDNGIFPDECPPNTNQCVKMNKAVGSLGNYGWVKVSGLVNLTGSSTISVWFNNATNSNGGSAPTGVTHEYQVLWENCSNAHPHKVQSSCARSLTSGNFTWYSENSSGGLQVINYDLSLISPNEWHNVVCTVNSSNSTMNMYLDGDLVGSTGWTSTYDLTTYPGDFKIGAGYSGTDIPSSGFYVGYFDDFIIDDRCWTSTEISDYFNAKRIVK